LTNLGQFEKIDLIFSDKICKILNPAIIFHENKFIVFGGTKSNYARSDQVFIIKQLETGSYDTELISQRREDFIGYKFTKQDFE